MLFKHILYKLVEAKKCISVSKPVWRQVLAQGVEVGYTIYKSSVTALNPKVLPDRKTKHKN